VFILPAKQQFTDDIPEEKEIKNIKFIFTNCFYNDKITFGVF
jgi:hypothetical protein